MARNRSESQRDWADLVRRRPLLFPEGDFVFECGPGWYDIIEKLCEKLERLVYLIPPTDRWHETLSLDEIPERKYKVVQVKEKFGTLRFYMDWEPDGADALIAEAEHESARTCERCGGPGKPRQLSWIQTLCDQHYDEVLAETNNK